ncbi:MAG: UDP-N-acetylmuramoyl-L-alanine--D-glutamate ligase [Peptococcaceae bacterium]|nr:UDP-N-acetylmuramoyl-L-alanine--D-glutamate ligase [Peptococcaceae bacterium]
MGEKVLVIGAARSGLAGAEFLAKQGNQVVLTDMKQAVQVDNLAELGVSFVWGEQPDVEAIKPDYIVMSPGVPLTIPPVKYAKEHGIPVIGELELAYRNCKAPFAAITGTNGKTTTTTLIGELMKKTGRQVFVGGNIGVPIITYADKLQEEDIVVAEVSSFQLETVESFCPHLALMINLTPDHLDRHGDMAGYLAAKARIFENQKESDYLVLNYDDEALRELAPQSRGKVIFFSQKHKLEEGVYLDGSQVMLALNGESLFICNADEIAIKGKHNLENAMGAIVFAYLSGVRAEDIRDVLMTFQGVEHRLEPVRTLNEVLYINDSKGTNPDSTIKAIEAYDRSIVIILGGKNKGVPFTELAGLVKQRVKKAVLVGQAKEELAEALDAAGFNDYVRTESFEEAVTKAAELAEPGDIVLLSPACTSWDMFSSFEERGRLFKKLVMEL